MFHVKHFIYTFHWCYSSARSAHLLHRPCENIVPVGIQPIAKRFSMAGCRLQFSWLICNPLVEQLRYPSVENHFARKRTFADSTFSVRLQNYSLRIKYAGLVGQYNCYSMRQATKGYKFHASMEIYDLVERKTPKNSHFLKK